MRPEPAWTAAARGLLPVAALLLTAATYRSAVRAARPWFGFTREWLATMMQIEFLVIHSFAFIMLVAWWKPQTVPLKVLRWTVFAAFSGLYLYAAFESEGGWASVAAFLGLTAVTYLGAMLRRLATGEMVLLGFRWLFNSFAFLFLADKLGLPDTVNDWAGRPEVLNFGFWYFAALALVEVLIAGGRWLAATAMKEPRSGLGTPPAETPPTPEDHRAG